MYVFWQEMYLVGHLVAARRSGNLTWPSQTLPNYVVWSYILNSYRELRCLTELPALVGKLELYR